MRSRIPLLVLVVAVAAAACSSDDVDLLTTDTCEVLTAFSAGEVTLDQVESEFERIVERAEEAGVSVDLIEAQAQVRCFDALQDYADATGLEGG